MPIGDTGIEPAGFDFWAEKIPLNHFTSWFQETTENSIAPFLPVDSQEPGIPGTDKPQLIPGTGTKSCVEMCPECFSLSVMHPFGQIMEGYETCAVVLLLVIRSPQTQRTTRVQGSFCWGGRDEDVLHYQREMGIPFLDICGEAPYEITDRKTIEKIRTFRECLSYWMLFLYTETTKAHLKTLSQRIDK